MEFNFSIRSALRESWATFKSHFWFFVGIAFVMLVLNAFSRTHDSWILQLIVIVASVIWSYICLSVALAAVDKKEGMLGFKALKLHLPTFRQFFKLIFVGFGSGVIILAGFILLIIPGIYFMTRLIFSNLAYVDRQGKARDALRYSWQLVKGETFWTVFLTMMVTIALIFLGIMVVVVGVLITYPIAMLLMANLYRFLTKHQNVAAIIEQPKEISPAIELEEISKETIQTV